MNLKEIEEDISKLLSKYRKDISGRGPIDTSSRIVGHTIYMKMNLSYTSHEKTMYKFIMKNNELQDYSKEFLEDVKIMFNNLFDSYGLDANTENLILQPDYCNDYLYAIFLLDRNIEKEIRAI